VKKIVIAFDVDGTLISNAHEYPKANERIRTLLVTLASFKNVTIVVWSGGGELYANQIARAIGIDRYVDKYYSKNHLSSSSEGKRHAFDPPITPDIAIDDIQDCELGLLNLIVRER
jgi:phosphoserine phosphatase